MPEKINNSLLSIDNIDKLKTVKHLDNFSRESLDKEILNQQFSTNLTRLKEISLRSSEISKELNQNNLSEDNRSQLEEELHKLVSEGDETGKEIKRLSTLIDFTED